MNISELLSLTQWISREITEAQIPQKHQNLYSILQNNIQTNQSSPSLMEREDLLEALKNVPLMQLNRDQLNFLSQLGIAQEVGDEGISNLENNLYKNVLDLATSAKNITSSYQNIVNGVSKSEQIRSGLADLVIEDEYDFHNEVLMRVTFTGNAAMANIVDFKTWGAAWHDIGRGIAMANNAAPEDIKIIGATKGSIVI